MYGVLFDKPLKYKMKEKLCRLIVRPVVLHGAETPKIRRTQGNK